MSKSKILHWTVFTILIVFSPAGFCQSFDQTVIKGTWKSVCMDLGGVYIMTTVSFDGAGASNDRTDFFNDAACSAPTGMAKINSKVGYSIGPKMGQQGDLDLYPIDVTIQATSLTQNGTVLKSGGPLPKQFDVIAIKGDTLYMSALDRPNKGPITSPAERPTRVDTKNIYTRQK
jgi:hypothetical protein